MAWKLTEARKRVLTRLVHFGGVQSFRLARECRMTQTSAQSALQFLRRQGLVEYEGYWRATDAGREALIAASRLREGN